MEQNPFESLIHNTCSTYRVNGRKKEPLILSSFPCWSWDPFADSYIKAIENLRTFYETYKEEPRHGGTRSNEEMLSRCIGIRRREKRNEVLSKELEAKILSTFPWWSWDPITDSHNKTITDLKTFYEIYKEEPKQREMRPNEKTLAKWVVRRRQEKKKGVLSKELEAKILSDLPWWSWSKG